MSDSIKKTSSDKDHKVLSSTYTITGMTCGGCEAKVKKALEAIPHVSSVEVSHQENKGVISSNEPIPFVALRRAMEELGDKYDIQEEYTPEVESTGHTASEQTHATAAADSSTTAATGTTTTTTAGTTTTTDSRTWFETYKPVILLFIYIGTASTLVELASENFSWMNWMRWFMAGFFLAFSFFKFLDLKGFANSYRMYDIVAKKFPAWSYVYAYTELMLGFAYLFGFEPFWVSLITFTVMTISIIGVLQTVLNNQVIQCACLGKVFDLPMSTVTIIEDGLMIVMAAIMIFQSLNL